MKINMPVTNTEVTFDDTEFMLTKTDLKGVITYANTSFIKISGFSESELIGQNHNMVRHPDMPVEAFADMWRNLKAGQPWTGLVKNRTKAGDYYWVEANASPIVENDQVVGFLSVRRKPARQQIEAAEAAYRLFRENKADSLVISNGKVERNNFMFKLKNSLLDIAVGKRLLSLIGLSILIAAILGGLGIYGLSSSKNSLRTVYEDRMIPVEQLGKISNLILESRTLWRTALSEAKVSPTATSKAGLVLAHQAATEAATGIEKNIAAIDSLWKTYLATYLTPEEKRLAENSAASREKFVNEDLKPAVIALKAQDYDATLRLTEHEYADYLATVADFEALLKLQFNVAKQEYDNSSRRYENTRLISFIALGLAAAILLWLGLALLRSIIKPLENALEAFRAIANGKLNTEINARGNNELSQVLFGLKSMQTMVGANLNEQQELANHTKVQAVQYEGQLAAISKSTGVIEFDMHGKVIAANDILLKVLGFSLSEVLTFNHSAFVEDTYRSSPAYKQFWEQLNRGESITGEFLRLGKNGREIWLQASYNPILDVNGKSYKVVQYATDITEQKIKNADFEGQVSAIGKSQGVIEISLDGKVLKVNETYLKMLGYTEKELLGQPVSIVLDQNFAKSAEYAALWQKLVQGGNDSGQYKRIAKNGREVWIQASYNPIFDLNGKPYKVVNYTIDITEQKVQAADNAGQISAINKLQGVVEFDLGGKIIAVNDNFANVTGYAAREIVGNHHSMFVEAAFKTSHEYKAFWERLAKGEAEAGQYKRIAKGGREVWLQASYNPIFDLNGKPYKVVKYATDISEQVNAQQALTSAVEETQEIIAMAKSGDLSERIPLDGKSGAIAQLCDGVNALIDNMTEVIAQVKDAGETINTAAGEISSGNNDLSSRTEQQASSLEETASSMEELASTVKQNAENAKQANQLAAAASGVAVKGGEVVGLVVNTMSAINSSAKKIEDIISVIDGIAFQTNILALNAAVEAARAGEQGRGFAVVAGEVRNLAQRSASDAKEIKELITDSVNKTAEGTTQVEQAGKTMAEIVSSVQRVTDIMGEISAASSEQSAGIDQVNNAITSMDEVTQQNAALVEQAAAAAESLVEQAITLMDTVNGFKLAGASSAKAERRSSKPSTKPMLARTPAKPAKAQATFATKTGTTDGDWEEF
ncbi:MAG: PAS domain S-box protein [Methylophilaceae bacterium]|nr:PAS domain S-box protein [Methylophilaceae bacterium]